MIYTIGNIEGYERAFNTLAPLHPRKLGRCMTETGLYVGGCCWQTRLEAEAYLQQEGMTGSHRVWGLDAVWDVDTEPDLQGRAYHNLLTSAYLNRLEPEVVESEKDAR